MVALRANCPGRRLGKTGIAFERFVIDFDFPPFLADRLNFRRTQAQIARHHIEHTNGNSRNYSATDANHTKVTIKDPLNAVVYSYTAGFDANMSGTTSTNGANVVQATKTFASPNTPYRPSSITDALGRTSSSTWDQFGNCLTSTTPRNLTTTNTYSYANFALGRVTQVQEGSKTATNLVYFEPSGLPQTISSAKPGTVSTGQQVTTSYTWDGLGNILTVVAPGNNATATNTSSFNYTSDGAYSQSAAIGQPLKVTDNLGRNVHFRYDSQGRKISTTDALGNESDMVYNLIGQTFQSILPSTGQTGSGNSYTQNTYQYIGGPLSQTTAYDESAVSIRQVVNAYGAEGETLSVTGSTEPQTSVYDALYRMKTLKDGNLNSTNYAYNSAGYISSMVYPGGDTIQFTSYDALGNILQRIDGRGVVTNFTYNDVENRLTDIQYPASNAINVHLTYDSYGRKSTLSDGVGSRTVVFDDKDSPLSIVTTFTSLPGKTISYSYYPDGSIQTLGTPAGNFNYAFDAVGQVISLTNPFSENFSWTYLDNGWLATQQCGNAVKTNYALNPIGQITRLLNSKLDSTILSDFSGMSYDGAGNQRPWPVLCRESPLTAAQPPTNTIQKIRSLRRFPPALAGIQTTLVSTTRGTRRPSKESTRFSTPQTRTQPTRTMATATRPPTKVRRSPSTPKTG